MLEQIFVEFPGRIFHAPRMNTHDSNGCPLCADISNGAAKGAVDDILALLPAKYPYVPGHALLVPTTHFRDLSRVQPKLGEQIFSAISSAAERIGGKHWLIANVGWVAGQTIDHFSIHVLPDPWHVPENFVEESKRLPTFDPLTDVFTDKLRFKRFHVRYGAGAHMTGFIISDFSELKRAVSKIRAKFGQMRNVLYHEREAMLERGKVPHVGYHLLVINYNGPQFVVVPRVFVPKNGRWGALELFYNADLSRDLEGDAEKAFRESHTRLVEELAESIFK